MTSITIELDDRVLKRISEDAAETGEDVEHYAASVLSRAAGLAGEPCTGGATGTTEEVGDINSKPIEDERPRTLYDELKGYIGIVDSRTVSRAPMRFGDIYEENFAKAMDEKYPPRQREGDIERF